MKIKDIELFNISRFRAEHMGMAMLFVILFHVFLPRYDDFYGLRRMGNLGVDIFLFLSGVGLWFSWANKQIGELANGQIGQWRWFFGEYVRFYGRRLLRIYPTWLIIALMYYIPRFNFDTAWHWIDFFGEVLFNWEFWIRDELAFWYIPATMMLYLFAPPYMELIRRHPIYRWLVVVMVMWCVLVQYVTPIHQAVGHIEIFWSRVPIFFLGINMGEAVRRRETLDGQSIWMIWIAFLMTLGTGVWLEQELHGRFPLFLERMLYIPLTVTTILLLNRVFRRTPLWFNRMVAWFGALSLEAYLIHLAFVLKWLTPMHLGYWPTFLLTVGITMPLAWLLQTTVGRLTNLIFKGKEKKKK